MFFPDIQSKPPLAPLEAISPHPVTCHQWEETNPIHPVITFQVLEESNKVSPQPPLPQTKQPQFLQSLLIGHTLQAFTSLIALLWTCSSTSMSKCCSIVWKTFWKMPSSPSNIDSCEVLGAWHILPLTTIISASLTVYNSLVAPISYIPSVGIKHFPDSAFENPSVPVAPPLTACVAVPSRLAGTSLMSCLVSDQLTQQLLHQS